MKDQPLAIHASSDRTLWRFFWCSFDLLCVLSSRSENTAVFVLPCRWSEIYPKKILTLKHQNKKDITIYCYHNFKRKTTQGHYCQESASLGQDVLLIRSFDKNSSDLGKPWHVPFESPQPDQSMLTVPWCRQKSSSRRLNPRVQCDLFQFDLSLGNRDWWKLAISPTATCETSSKIDECNSDINMSTCHMLVYIV